MADFLVRYAVFRLETQENIVHADFNCYLTPFTFLSSTAPSNRKNAAIINSAK